MILALLVFPPAARAASVDAARALLNEGKARQALPDLRKASEADPDDLDLRCDLARALAWSDLSAEAEGQYSAVLAKQPAHREALLGLLRLRGYQGRPAAAMALAEQGLERYPGDSEFLAERRRLRTVLNGADCERVYRYTARVGYSHEDYNFAGPGNGVNMSVQDRRFHGWNASAGTSYAHRFGLDDLDLGVEAARPVPWRGAYAGFSLGGATRHVILPAFRGALEGGVPLGAGFTAEGVASFRHYDSANIYALSPLLTWEGRGILAQAGYSLANTYYTSGSRSGWLASYQGRLEWERWCRLKPWISYARSKESFEPGATNGISNFSADHYSVGATARVLSALDLSPYYAYEWRPVSRQKIITYGVGLAYSWGSMR